MRADADGDLAGVRAGDAGAEDHDLRRAHAGAPESSTPRPPFCACRHQAPTCTASRPATSLIGASSGSEPSSSWIVS